MLKQGNIPLIASELVPEGCQYIQRVPSRRNFKAGDKMPLPQVEDIFITPDYTYELVDGEKYDICSKTEALHCEDTPIYPAPWKYGWRFYANNQRRRRYGPIQNIINGIEVRVAEFAFQHCAEMKKSPALPDSLTHAYDMFEGCVSMENAPELPRELLDMEQMFMKCTILKEMPKIPNAVIIMDAAFRLCINLEKMADIPQSVKHINNCFAECNSLIKLSPLPQCKSFQGTFQYCKKIENVPDNYIPDGAINITQMFKNCINLKKTPRIPDSVKIMIGAFEHCASLTKIENIPCSVEKASFAFAHCTTLTKIPKEIPASMNDMAGIYKGCENITIGPVIASGSKMKDMCAAFKDCKNLKYPPILPPKGVASIASMFDGCEKLEVAPELPKDIKNAEFAFRNCTELEAAPVIPDSVKSFSCIFDGCKKLTGFVEINAKIFHPKDASLIFSEITNPIYLRGRCTILKDVAECSNGLDVTIVKSV